MVTNTAATRRSKRDDALPEVNSRQLAAVRAVAEYRSFIAAAAHLGISQPALTLTIKRLEQTLGLPLFARNTRHVAVTPAGREFVDMAERVLNDLKLGMKSLRDVADRQRGQVIVTTLVPLRMSDVIAEYARRFPGIEIQLREGYQEQVRDDLRAGISDFGIGNLGDLPASYLTESLGVLPLWVVMHKDHPMARLKQIEFKALRDITLVSLPIGSDVRRLIDATASAAGFTLRHSVTVGLPLTLLNLVAASVGIAVTPAHGWRRGGQPNLVTRPLVPQLAAEIGIIRLADRQLSPAAAGLLALARERLRIGRGHVRQQRAA